MKAFGDEREDLIRNQKEHRSLAWYSWYVTFLYCPWGMVQYKYGIFVHVQYILVRSKNKFYIQYSIVLVHLLLIIGVRTVLYRFIQY